MSCDIPLISNQLVYSICGTEKQPGSVLENFLCAGGSTPVECKMEEKSQFSESLQQIVVLHSCDSFSSKSEPGLLQTNTKIRPFCFQGHDI